MAPGGKKKEESKGKTAEKAPRPKRGTVLITYCNSGLGASLPLGLGSYFRRVRSQILLAYPGQVDVVGSGLLSVGTGHPLEATLRETAANLGHIDWLAIRDLRHDDLSIVHTIKVGLQKWFDTDYVPNPVTGKLEFPGRFPASATFVSQAKVVAKKGKKKKKK